MSTWAERLASVEARIVAACDRAGRDRSEVRLIAVSKTQPPEAVEAAYAVGLRDFGENYAQSLRDKAAALELEGLAWHFIGHLQKNKVKYVVGTAAMVHAVDSVKLARAICERAEREGVTAPELCLAVNIAGQDSKSGVEPDEARALLEGVAAVPGARVVGLFGMPPPSEDPEAARPHFARLRALRDELSGTDAAGGRLKHLSMGMSHDLEVAVEEGATLVRVGTALFGPRRST